MTVCAKHKAEGITDEYGSCALLHKKPKQELEITVIPGQLQLDLTTKETKDEHL